MSKVVLAVSGSLRKPSFTDKMLDLCVEGMGAGVEFHKFYPHTMEIEPCAGCWTCWKAKDGKCMKNDDFQKIVEVYLQADYFLFAAPVYYFSFPATVKNVIDRFFAFLEPTQRLSAHGRTEHPKRGGRHPKTVLISSCGFPEVETFDLVRALFRRICEEMEWDWAGEILIPGAGAAYAPKLFDRKLTQIREAGAELAADRITARTTRAIAAPVMSDEDYRAMCSASFGGLFGKAKAAAIAIQAMGWLPPPSNEDA
jgi:putative NADPH-quinone reductase